MSRVEQLEVVEEPSLPVEHQAEFSVPETFDREPSTWADLVMWGGCDD